jgi:hypothetical protein
LVTDVAKADPTKIAEGAKGYRTMVQANPQAPTLGGRRPQSVGTLLFAQQIKDAKSLGGKFKSGIATTPGAVHHVTVSNEGRMAIAGIIVNGIGALYGWRALKDKEAQLNQAKVRNASPEEIAEAEKAVNDAFLGLADSGAGLTAGLLDATRVGVEYMQLNRSATAKLAEAAAAAKKAGTPIANVFMSTELLKFGAALAGTCGGIVNALVSYGKANEADAKGLTGVRNLHLIASYAAWGGTALAGASLLASGAQVLVIRGVGGFTGAAARGIAFHVGRFVGMSLVPGVGWALLGVSVVSTVGAAILDPTPLEAWARQTPFGYAPKNLKFKTLQEQEAALLKALGVAETPKT